MMAVSGVLCFEKDGRNFMSVGALDVFFFCAGALDVVTLYCCIFCTNIYVHPNSGFSYFYVDISIIAQVCKSLNTFSYTTHVLERGVITPTTKCLL